MSSYNNRKDNGLAMGLKAFNSSGGSNDKNKNILSHRISYD